MLLQGTLQASAESAKRENQHNRQRRSDDVGSTEILVQHLSQEVTHITAKRTALEVKQATSRKSVAFYAHKSADPFNAVKGSPIAYNVVHTNVANAYDHQTGIFTAPVTGTYGFHVTCMDRHDANAAFAVGIVANDVTVAECWSQSPLGQSEQATTYAVVHMQAGQRAWGRSENTEDARGGFYSTFGGYLITPDA